MRTSEYNIRKNEFMNYIHGEENFTDEQVERLASLFVRSVKSITIDIQNNVSSTLQSLRSSL